MNLPGSTRNEALGWGSRSEQSETWASRLRRAIAALFAPQPRRPRRIRADLGPMSVHLLDDIGVVRERHGPVDTYRCFD